MTVVDELFYKRPFKGKGASRMALRDAQAQVEQIDAAMQALSAQYKQTFRPPRAVSLMRHAQKGTCIKLRWRSARSFGQAYFELFSPSEHAWILDHYSAEAKRVLAEFERQRIDLNTQMIMAHAQRALSQYYLDQTTALDAFNPCA